MVKLEDIYDIKTGPDGKVTIEKNMKRVEAKKPVCARGKSKKVRYKKHVVGQGSFA